MANLDQCILDAAKAAWTESFLKVTPNKDNCSGFVKSVAGKLGVPLPATADADGLAEALAASWTRLKSGAEAARSAATCHLVLAVLKGADHNPPRHHGHIGVVVAGPLYRDTYPTLWCGSLGGQAQSQGDKSVGEVWNRADRDSVGYYEYSTSVCRP
jgi:hypothetical protein